MPHLEVNGQRFFVEDSGGDNPTIVFSHGFLMDHEMFVHQVAHLTDRYRVITWDWRGFGATETDGKPFSIWDQADDLWGIIDHLGIDRVVLAGMSHGGYITMRAAIQHPERVRAVVLMDTNAAGLGEEEAAGYRGMFDAWINNGPGDELCNIFANIIIGAPEVNAAWIEKWKAWPQDRLATPAQATIEAEDIRPRLADITCPALVIHGVDDAAFPVQAAEDIANAILGAEPVAIVPGGHAACLTHPGPVNDAIDKFLATL
jgi:pimeloyl-ACP methyl ester carboxylesterase